MQQDGFFLQEIPLAAISEIQGDMLTYIVGTDGSRFSAKLSEVVGKMQQDAGCLCVQTAKLDIPSAEVLTLNTTPKAFGLNVPAGFYVKPLGCDFFLTFNSVAYATNGQLGLIAAGGTQSIMESNPAAIFRANSGGGQMELTPDSNTDQQLIAAADLLVFIASGDPTAGDSDITVYLTYVLVPL